MDREKEKERERSIFIECAVPACHALSHLVALTIIAYVNRYIKQ